MSTTRCQVVGFLLSILGLAGCIVATEMDMWSTQDLYDNPVTAVFQYEGLWRSCVQQSSGFTECRPYLTILGLPAMLQAVRALMIVGIVLSVIGLLVAIFALKCIRMGNMDDSAKAKMTLTSGIMFIIAGLCAIAGVSVFANMLVTNFWMSTASMFTSMGGMVQTVQTRYTFGAALFVGWVAGGLTLIGGVLMCIACRGLAPEETNYKAVSYHASGHNVAYRPGGFKASTGFESNTRNKKIYDGGARTEDEGQSPPSKNAILSLEDGPQQVAPDTGFSKNADSPIWISEKFVMSHSPKTRFAARALARSPSPSQLSPPRRQRRPAPSLLHPAT